MFAPLDGRLLVDPSYILKSPPLLVLTPRMYSCCPSVSPVSFSFSLLSLPLDLSSDYPHSSLFYPFVFKILQIMVLHLEVFPTVELICASLAYREVLIL